jgi:hypothetical protein
VESGHEPVMRLAVEDPEWLPLVKAAWEFAQHFGNHFSGKWILGNAQRSLAIRSTVSRV